jgi:tetratricopeptide (TPR) repeat protein
MALVAGGSGATIRRWHVALALFLAGPIVFLFVARVGKPPAVPAPDADALAKARDAAAAAPSRDAFVALSYQYYRNRQYPESIFAARKALERDPNSAVAYNNICSAYAALGRWDDAIAAGRKALAIDPRFQLARNNLVWALRQKAGAASREPVAR